MSLQRLLGAVYLTVAILGSLLSHSSGQTPCSISCEPITISQCSSQSYSKTGFPNFYNHTSQKRAAEFANSIDIAEAFNCFANSRRFICGLLLPECRENEGLILPSRQLCMDFFTGCRNLLERTGNSHLILDCTDFALDPMPICKQPMDPPTEVPITMPAVDNDYQDDRLIVLLFSNKQLDDSFMERTDIDDAFVFVIMDFGPTDAFAIITDLLTGTILTGPISTFKLIQVPLNGVSTPVAVDYDPLEEMMYWTDTGRRTISRARLDGAAQEVVMMLSSRSVANGLVLDVENKQIYWTDAAENTIESAGMDGSNRHVILNEALDQPIAIILKPADRHLFWTAIGTPAKIERANYDGSERVTLIDTDIQTPNGLAIDFSEQKLYWCDEGLGRIESSDLEGGNRDVLISSFSVSNVFQPFDIGIYMGFAYWTDWQLETILRTDHFGNPDVVGPPLSRPGGLHIQQDIEKPILECPNVEEQFVVTRDVTDQLQLVDVLWPEPTYSDNSGLLGGIISTQTSPSVFGIGVHNVTYSAWDPYGNAASCSITITVTAACPENSATVNSTPFLWPQTPALNQDVDSNERCDVRTENRGRGLATRVCMRDDIRTALWLEPVYIGCGEEDNFNLADLSETPVIDSNVENVAEALNNVTRQQSDEEFKLTTDDLQNIADTLGNIVNVESVTPEVTMTVIQIVNNLVDLTEQPETNQAEDSSAEYYVDILLAIEQQVNRSTAAGLNLTAVEPNIAVTITTVMPNQPTGFSFAVLDSDRDEFREEDIQTYSDPVNIPRERRTAVILPPTIFNTTSNDTIGVSFVVHNSDVLFPTNSTNQTVGSDIVSAIVTGVENIENLSQPVVFEFSVSGKNAYCVFWDFEILDWSSKGCQLQVTTDNRTICHCYHLTNFAVLVDVSYEKVHIILDYVSKIGCVVSMLTLLITLIIFIGFRRLRIGTNAIPRQILINLCFALFFLYFIFLVGIDQISHRNGCICVAFLLQYFTLASLMWMGIEGFNLYLVVVWPFEAHPRYFVLKVAVIAWGLPLVISLISLREGFSNYDHLKYCFATGPPLYYGVVLPIAVILLFNVAVFSVVTYRLCKANLGGNAGQKSTKEKNIQRLKNAYAMSILMGLSWIFGFFTIGGAQFVLSLIFCLCNSLQGLVLFLLFCARQEDVKKQLQKTFSPYVRRLGCCKTSSPAKRSQTASTDVASSSSQSKSLYNDLDFSASSPPSQAPDNYTDLSVSVPMLPLKSSANKYPYENAGYTMKQKDEPVSLNDGELSQDNKLKSVAVDADTKIKADDGYEAHIAVHQEMDGGGLNGQKMEYEAIRSPQYDYLPKKSRDGVEGGNKSLQEDVIGGLNDVGQPVVKMSLAEYEDICNRKEDDQPEDDYVITSLRGQKADNRRSEHPYEDMKIGDQKES